jgi:putative peptidoglycan lipid II flippase
LLFQGGKFDVASTHRTALALGCLAPGLVAFSGVNMFARAFYALGDTRTPMRISVFCVVLNLLLSLWLVGPFRQAGLGLANTVTSALNLWLLSRALGRKLKTLDLAELRAKLICLIPAALVAGAAAWAAYDFWRREWGHATLVLRLGEVFVPALAALVVYLGLAAWLKVGEARQLLGLVTRKLRRRRD